MKQYKLILFDLDGTVINSDEMLFHALYDLYDKYNNGVKKPTDQLIQYSGPIIEETLAKEFPQVDSELILKEYLAASAKYSKEYVFPILNIVEVVNKLKEKGIITGVVTNKHTGDAIKTFKYLNMDNLFDVLIGFDDVVKHKPDGEGILKAMDMYSIKNKNDVLYVGDNNSDYYTAVNAGVDSALINWGARASLINVKPTWLLKDFDSLLGD